MSSIYAPNRSDGNEKVEHELETGGPAGEVYPY